MNKWKSLVNFMQLQRSVRTIDLDRTYESCFEPGVLLENIVLAKTNKPLHGLLSNSVYVQFLNKLVNLAVVKDDEIKETQYYKESWECVGKYGSYQGRIKDESALVEHCRGFLRLYEILKLRVRTRGFIKYIRTVKDHITYGYPDVFAIKNSDRTMVYDGAHRLACYWVLGERFIRVKIIGTITGPIRFPQGNR